MGSAQAFQVTKNWALSEIRKGRRSTGRLYTTWNVKIEEIEEAVKTLKHEFLDYMISKIIEPYRNFANRLITMLNEEAYRRKEEIIESLCELI